MSNFRAENEGGEAYKSVFFVKGTLRSHGGKVGTCFHLHFADERGSSTTLPLSMLIVFYEYL
jgi:hypothetical protein